MNNIKISNVLNSLPLIFEKNIGQHDEKIQFALNKKECTTFFNDNEIILSFRSNEKIQELKELENSLILNEEDKKYSKYGINILRVSFENGNKSPQIIGKNEFNCRLNYFKGENSLNWKCSIPLYEKLLYKEIYKGIDILYYESEGTIKWEFQVSSKKSLDKILLNFQGANNIYLDEEGNININIKENILKILNPRVTQEDCSCEVTGNFEINEEGKVKFCIQNYENEKNLKITLPIVFEKFNSTFVVDRGNSIAVDENKCIYITGEIGVQKYPNKKPHKNILEAKDYSAFLVKIDSSKKGQSALKYAAYIGGEKNDEGIGIAVDDEENAYIVGSTNSEYEFPITEKSYASNYPGGNSTGFLIKIDTSKVGLNSFIYGTYLGGNLYDYAYSVAIDKNKNVYVCGLTNSSLGFPITENGYKKFNCESVDVGFLLKLDISKKGKEALLYGTYFGGNDSTNFSALAIDQNNYVYITGITQSSDFPVTENSYKTKVTGGLSSAFITKFDLEKDGEEGVLYSSLLCGNGEEAGYGIAVDLEENVYITGTTNSREDFPISENAFQKNIYAIEGSGFFIKLDTKLCGDNGLIYGTYLGGNGSDVCSDIKIDSNGYAYICGFTTSTDFPVEGYDNGWVKDGYNSFFIKIDPSKEKRKSLLVGKFLRKNISDFALAMAIDNNLNLYITGYSHSISKSMEKREGNYYEEAAIGMIKIDARICNLSVTKSSYNNQAKIGEITEYEISIINNGPDKAKDIEIMDVIGDGKAIKEIEVSKGEISNIAKKIIWNIRELNIGERAWATIRVRVLDNSESIKDNNFINLKDNIYYSKEYIKEYMDECILNK